MKIVVTGGAGFIGSALVRALLRRGDRVKVFDNFSTGKRSNLAGLPQPVEVLEGDLRDPKAVERGLRGAEAVLHQGALGSVPRSIDDPVTTDDVNTRGTLNVLVAARALGIRRVVVASSSSVYGDAPEPVKEETLPVRPLSPYAVSKFAGEAYALVFAGVYGLETVALRYFNVFGPRQDPESMYAAVVPKFVTALLEGHAPTVYGDGEQSRDFTYVDNVVEANLLALSCPKEACGRAYNVACGRSTSVNDLFRMIRAAVADGAEPKERARILAIEPEYAPPRPGDVRHSLASIAHARARLGYQPGVSVEEGIWRTVAWYREERARIRAG